MDVMPAEIVAIDPGTQKSGLVQMTGRLLRPYITSAFAEYDNDALLDFLRGCDCEVFSRQLVVERVQHYGSGMPVGAEVFDTVEWTGRFIEAAHRMPVARITRPQVKLALCGTARAKDANVRQALLDLYGGRSAQGTKKHPGPLYGVKGHAWAALAVGVAWMRQQREQAIGGAA